MNETYLLVLLAIGTGISLGWIFKAWHGKLNPDGIVKLSQSMAEINAGLRADAKAQIAAAEERAESYRTIAYNDATYWREHAQRLAMTLSPAAVSLPARAPTPPPAARPAATNGHLDPNQKKLYDLCSSRGMSHEAALAVARGETEDLPSDSVLDDMAAAVAQDESGAV